MDKVALVMFLIRLIRNLLEDPEIYGELESAVAETEMSLDDLVLEMFRTALVDKAETES